MDCVYLDVDTCGEMNVTTTYEIMTMTAAEYPDPKNAKTEVESTHQWKANLLPDQIVYGTRAASFWIF